MTKNEKIMKDLMLGLIYPAVLGSIPVRASVSQNITFGQGVRLSLNRTFMVVRLPSWCKEETIPSEDSSKKYLMVSD